MADLQSMTLTERMITINNTAFGQSIGLQDMTFQEACNNYLKSTSQPLNGVNYSSIGLNDYTPEEAFSIINHETDNRSQDLTELINDMANYGFHDYTATEALNKKAAIAEGQG